MTQANTPEKKTPRRSRAQQAEGRYSEEEMREYVMSVMLNETLHIPAIHSAIHADSVEWLNRG